MNFTLSCSGCGKKALFHNTAALHYFAQQHIAHLRSAEIGTPYITIKIFKENGEIEFAHNHHIAQTEYPDDIGDEMAQIIYRNSSQQEKADIPADKSQDKIYELRQSIEKYLQYLLDEQETKLATEARGETSYFFHLGRQLLATDMLKAINKILEERGK